MSRTNGDNINNRSLERALQILKCFSFERQSLSLSEISDTLSLPKATVLRLCSTLIKYRFLKQDNSKLYSLDLGIFELGSIVYNSISLRKVAANHLDILQKKLSITLFLGIIDNDELLYIDKRDEPKTPITFTSSVGTRRPAYWGMVGRVILAYMPENDRDKILQRYSSEPVSKNAFKNKGDLIKNLSQVKKQGYAVDKDTVFNGISGIAAPVFDMTGKIAGAIGAAFLSSSKDSKTVAQIQNEVIAVAKDISKDMGYIINS